MKTLVCFLEERSAQVLLETILPKILNSSEINFKYITFQGKQDLEKNLYQKLKGWKQPNSYFLVMRDKDAGDCIGIKENLKTITQNGGKIAETCIRIACCELEKLTARKYQKISGSRAIAPHLKIDGSNKSKSFNELLKGIKKLVV